MSEDIDTSVDVNLAFPNATGGDPISDAATVTMAELVYGGHINASSIDSYGEKVTQRVRGRLPANHKS